MDLPGLGKLGVLKGSQEGTNKGLEGFGLGKNRGLKGELLIGKKGLFHSLGGFI